MPLGHVAVPEPYTRAAPPVPVPRCCPFLISEIISQVVSAGNGVLLLHSAHVCPTPRRSEDAELAVQLVRLLDRHGVTAFWLTQEQVEKLEQPWQWDACIRQVQGDGSLVD